MKDKKQMISKCISAMSNCVFFLICIFGTYISFKMNGNNRSLWYDEAALSYSFSRRSFGELTKTTLEVAQSAPVFWLHMVKGITLFWGNTEYTLRIVSVLSYVFTLVIISFLSRRLCSIKFSMGVSAFVAMIPFFIKYSNVFKPYEFDSVCVLLVIVSYYLYRNGRLNKYILSAIWIILIWCSNPTCFFQGGFLIIEFVDFLRDRKNRNVFTIGISIFCSFILYYFYWLRNSVDSMQDYWDGSRFPILIYDYSTLKSAFSSFNLIFSQFEMLKTPFMILFFVGAIFAVIKKKAIMMGVYLGFVVTFIASGMGFFPISDRLWVFSYPLISMLAFYAINMIVISLYKLLIKKSDIGLDILLALMTMLLICINQGWKYLYTFNLYWPHQELNTEIEYVKNNIVEGESVYITSHAMCGYQYKMGYDNHSINDYEDVVYYNLGSEEGSKLIEELDNCYILVTHYTEGDPKDDVTVLLDILKTKGHLQLVSYEYYTPLYYFTTDANMLKDEVDPEQYSIFD